jgi:2-C-methyl-D-erythritol 4-phosphate cytidylyltransferase
VTRAPALAAVVLAAGRGERFGSPKQYARLAGERLVDRAVRFVRQFTEDVVVALPPDRPWDGPAVLAAVAGGASRTESMRHAMAVVPATAEHVLVHDAIRPLASRAVVRALLRALADGADGAMPVWTLPDTLKRQDPDGRIHHAGREGFVVAQGPTAFRADSLRRMFAEQGEIPIEESVGIERIGGRVVGVPGDRWSHHVVDARDLELMERLADRIDAES